MKTYTITIKVKTDAPEEIVEAIAGHMDVQLESLSDGTEILSNIEGDFKHEHLSTTTESN